MRIHSGVILFQLAAFALLLGTGSHAAEAPAALKTALNTASQGDVLDLAGLNPNYLYEPASITRTWSGPKLMFSDSPESPTSSGNLYVDQFAANTAVRVYLYHANGASTNKKFNVVVRNMGSVNATVQRTKMALAGPSTSYVYLGKVCVQRYMQATAASSLSLTPNQCKVLDTNMDAISATPGQLVNGIYDIQCDQPMKVYCLVTDPGTNAASVAPTLAVLARDSHDRGTFPYADKIVDYNTSTSQGMFQVTLADGSVDAAATGVDAVTGLASTLNGNYGVMYRFHVNAYGNDGRKLGFLFNPRAGALGIAVNNSAGIYPTGAVLIPPGTTNISDSTKATVSSKYSPAAGGSALWMQWMPAGSSSLPAKLLVTPY